MRHMSSIIGTAQTAEMLSMPKRLTAERGNAVISAITYTQDFRIFISIPTLRSQSALFGNV